MRVTGHVLKRLNVAKLDGFVGRTRLAVRRKREVNSCGAPQAGAPYASCAFKVSGVRQSDNSVIGCIASLKTSRCV